MKDFSFIQSRRGTTEPGRHFHLEDAPMSVNAVTYRRDLHRIPELDDELPETTAYVKKVLEPLGAEIFSPIKGSVCAYFDAGADETVALRADMDALPVDECTGLPFASQKPGRMHACGHDGHTAIELGVAEEVSRMLKAGAKLRRNVLFVFQPAEETTGGAGRLCETGVFKKYNVTRAFGLHLWPNLPEGSVWSRPGPMMARSNEVTLRVEGKSVHVSRAAEGLDALRAGVDWMNAAYAWTEALPPEVLRTLQFGRMTAGTVRNAVAGSAEIQGTLRTYEEAQAEMIRSHLRKLAAETAERTGCGLEVSFSTGYPAVWNNEALFACVSKELGADAPHLLVDPVLAAEDFSFYQREVPGVFFFLGVGPAEELHSPKFAWNDDAVIPAGVAYMLKILNLS